MHFFLLHTTEKVRIIYIVHTAHCHSLQCLGDMDPVLPDQSTTTIGLQLRCKNQLARTWLGRAWQWRRNLSAAKMSLQNPSTEYWAGLFLYATWITLASRNRAMAVNRVGLCVWMVWARLDSLYSQISVPPRWSELVPLFEWLCFYSLPFHAIIHKGAICYVLRSNHVGAVPWSVQNLLILACLLPSDCSPPVRFYNLHVDIITDISWTYPGHHTC